MDRRLYNAYDKITMPDGCSQKIETLLMEGTKTKTKRRNQVLLRPKSRWQTWSSAAALVCLAVVISLGPRPYSPAEGQSGWGNCGQQ